MAIGDYISSVETITGDGTLEIKPSSGDQIEIHMVQTEHDADLKISDDVNDVKLESLTGGTSYEGLKYELSNNFFIKVVNSTSGDNIMVYYGVKTKE